MGLRKRDIPESAWTKLAVHQKEKQEEKGREKRNEKDKEGKKERKKVRKKGRKKETTNKRLTNERSHILGVRHTRHGVTQARHPQMRMHGRSSPCTEKKNKKN